MPIKGCEVVNRARSGSGCVPPCAGSAVDKALLCTDGDEIQSTIDISEVYIVSHLIVNTSAKITKRLGRHAHIRIIH